MPYRTDPTSAFGGIITFNKKVNHQLISKILDKQFVEVIAAQDSIKKQWMLYRRNLMSGFSKLNLRKRKMLFMKQNFLRDKLLVQEKDNKYITPKDLTTVTTKNLLLNKLRI